MSPLQCVRKALGVFGLAMAVPTLAFSQSNSGYTTNGSEYAPVGFMVGDQLNASLALGPSRGILVWHDNISDTDGFGVSAVMLDASQSPSSGIFHVNPNGTNDQENAQVALLKNGGAAFVWQGGKQSFQHIYARFLGSNGVFLDTSAMVNTASNKYQIDPVIATLANGNVIIAWASIGQDNTNLNQRTLQGVYAQILSPTGQKVGGEFRVNQFTQFSQRNPVVAAFPNGNFIVAWASEQQRATNTVDIMARIYNSAGTPVGGEFLVNTGTNISANPAVAVGSDNNFMVAWSEKDLVVANNSWDIFARPFNAAGTGGVVQRVNTQQFGDQFAPKISVSGTDYLVIWTSLGQDGSREGVFGQFLSSDTSHRGAEFRVNSTILNAQKFPAVASDGNGRFLAVWSSYTGGVNSMDLMAQRYAPGSAPLAAPDPPIVNPVSSSRLTVTWPSLAGLSVSNFGLYVDGSSSPVLITNNIWSISPLGPSSTHSFTLDYLLTDGRRSPQSSPVVTGTTWGVDENLDGLPDDWQALYWGSNPPSPNAPLVPGGPTALQVFQWGANPLDPNTWLKTWFTSSQQGQFLNWTTIPGSVYQVESSPNFSDPSSWSALGVPRFATAGTDSIFVGSSSTSKFYRIKRLRF